MAHQVLDRVQETTTSVGTGALTLAGATNRMLSLSGAGFSNGDTFWGVIEHTTASEWEIALCTFSTAGPSITRAIPLKSSNANATVAFSAGTKTVTLVAPAAAMVVGDNNGDVSVARFINTASGYRFGGSAILDRSSNYTRILDSAGASVAQFGNAADPGNYLANDWHNFYNRAQNVVFARLNSVGLCVGGVNPTVAKIEAYAADGTYQLGVRGTTKGLRVNTTSAATTIEGVDTTLVASFQPLKLNGSTVTVQESGVDIMLFNVGAVRPTTDNATPMGHGSYRWTVIYAATGAINTSGRDTKLGIRAPSDAERRAAQRILAVGPKLYRFRDAVDAKGDAARLHAGYIAEDVRDALEAEGLDPWLYGFMCADEIMRIEKYKVTVERPKVRTVSDTERAVEIVDGQPVLVTREVTREEPVGCMLPVNDEKGEPVMVSGGEPDAEGHVPMVPLLHFVPDIETVEETRTREVPAGERRLGLRYSELEAFLHAADATRGS